MTTNVVFEKVDKARYLAKNVDDIFKTVKDMINELSGNDIDMYVDAATSRLYLNMVARRLGAEFFYRYNSGEVELSKDYPFAMITIEGFGAADFTVGVVIVKNRECRTTGVIFR